MGRVGEELALLAPGPLHRRGGPPGQNHRHPQQQQKRRQGNDQIGPHHLPEHGPLHGHIHKGQPLVQPVVPPEVAQAVVLDRALRRALVQAVLQNGGELRRVLQPGVGAAGDIGGVGPAAAGPNTDGEVGQQQLVPADFHADFRLSPAGKGLLLNHPVEHLAAQILHVSLKGGENGEAHRRQHGGDHGHADRHKFQPEFPDHGRAPFVHKFVETVKNH